MVSISFKRFVLQGYFRDDIFRSDIILGPVDFSLTESIAIVNKNVPVIGVLALPPEIA